MTEMEADGYTFGTGVDWGGSVTAEMVATMVRRVQPFRVPPAYAGVPAIKEPMLQGSVVGYRAWRIWDWSLTATGNHLSRWEPGVQTARCTSDSSHLAPEQDCGCGIYGMARFDPDRHRFWVKADVYGAIEAWSDEEIEVAQPGDLAHLLDIEPSSCERDRPTHGRFLIHARPAPGFRARHAKVVLLAVDPEEPRAKQAAIRALAAEHEADVCQLEHLEDAAREHGQLLPEELIEQARATTAVSSANRLQGLQHQMVLMTEGMRMSAQTFDHLLQALLSAQIVYDGNKAPKPCRAPDGLTHIGIKQTLRTVGPPSLGKWRKGDRVRDRKGNSYECVKRGSPGTWMQVL